MKEGYFCSQEKGKNLQKYFTSKKAKIRKSISQEKAKIRKSISQEKAEICKSILSILVFRRSNQIVSVVYKGIKKTFKFIISISEQNCNDKVKI